MRHKKWCIALAASLFFVPRVAGAEEAAAPWMQRYDEARQHLVQGEYRVAEQAFLDLAIDAPNDSERRLALEMARVAAEWRAKDEAQWRALEPRIHAASRARTRDEITLLYASAFLYGAGTGAWFLLQTQPDTALTATLPFIGITATPVVALAIVDGNWPLPRGMPHAITAGMYLGLGEGVWVTSYQHARADRVGSGRWKADDVASVLWGGATLGAVVGGTMAIGLPTTPGRVSFIASATIWSGALSGFATSALIRETPHRAEHTALAAGIGYNAGLLAGLRLAEPVSPTVTRVRLVDLAGVAGGAAVGGTYLAIAGHDADAHATLGLTAAGAAIGLTLGWIATSDMPRELPPDGATPPTITLQPSLAPVPGGATLGVAGAL